MCCCVCSNLVQRFRINLVPWIVSALKYVFPFIARTFFVAQFQVHFLHQSLLLVRGRRSIWYWSFHHNIGRMLTDSLMGNKLGSRKSIDFLMERHQGYVKHRPNVILSTASKTICRICVVFVPDFILAIKNWQTVYRIDTFARQYPTISSRWKQNIYHSPSSLYEVLTGYNFFHSKFISVFRGYHVLGPTLVGKKSKPLRPSRLPFLKTMLEDLGRLVCLELATELSLLHSADGFSAAYISPRGFSSAGLWKTPLDGPLTRWPLEQWQRLTLCSHTSSVLASPFVNGTAV